MSILNIKTRWSKLSAFAMQAANGGGGGTSKGILVGMVTKGSSFPTKRPDGSPLQNEDYVKVDGNTPDTDFPFTISGITFKTRKDLGIYINNRWTLDPGIVQDTSETPTTNRDVESLNGNGTTQAQVNLQVANAIGKKKTISVEDKTNIIDAINYIWTECKKAGYIFSLTETDTDSIRDIVINIKDKDENVLLNKTLSDFILKTRKIAGYDLADDITDQEIQDAIKELTATLKNKTMSADDNTFSDFTPDEFKASAKKEGSANNDKFTTQGYVDDEIAKVVATTYTFKGYISTTQPTSAKVGNLWYESDTLPTTFPINVKTYNGTTWSATTSEYTPDDLDLWSLVADKHGYYWFGGEWNILDTSQARTDDKTIQRNNQDELEVKNGGITNDKLATDIKVGSLANLLTTAKDSVVNAINELFNNKQDKITDSTNANNPIDSDKVSEVSATNKTNKTWTFTQVWNWVKTKIKTSITNSLTDADIVSGKAVYNYVKGWTYVVILGATQGSTLTLTDEQNNFTEMLIVMSASEGTNQKFNYAVVIPKVSMNVGSANAFYVLYNYGASNTSYNNGYWIRERINYNEAQKKLTNQFVTVSSWTYNGAYIYVR